jgi:hypothetical protein
MPRQLRLLRLRSHQRLPMLRLRSHQRLPMRRWRNRARSPPSFRVRSQSRRSRNRRRLHPRGVAQLRLRNCSRASAPLAHRNHRRSPRLLLRARVASQSCSLPRTCVPAGRRTRRMPSALSPPPLSSPGDMRQRRAGRRVLLLHPAARLPAWGAVLRKCCARSTGPAVLPCHHRSPRLRPQRVQSWQDLSRRRSI